MAQDKPAAPADQPAAVKAQDPGPATAAPVAKADKKKSSKKDKKKKKPKRPVSPGA
jgi:hypothetical protein